MVAKTVDEVYRKYSKFDHLIETTQSFSEVPNPKFLLNMLQEFWQAIKYEAFCRTDDGR